MENQNSKRIILIISGAIDSMLGAVALLIYFNVLPIDVGVPRLFIGIIGGILFFSGIAVITYFLTRTDHG
jgi:hypothetical protein